MGKVMLEIPESQVVEWVRQMSPSAKQDVLRALIPRLDALEALVDAGDRRVHTLCAERGLDWDSLSEEERERLVDEQLHGERN
jgi:hypothetical protein